MTEANLNNVSKFVFHIQENTTRSQPTLIY
jgi:hypothetical protein